MIEERARSDAHLGANRASRVERARGAGIGHGDRPRGRVVGGGDGGRGDGAAISDAQQSPASKRTKRWNKRSWIRILDLSLIHI